MTRCHKLFDVIADRITYWTGNVYVAVSSIAVVATWIVGGFFLGFTDTYQLIINTGTTIITFIMVFFIQHSQNKDVRAIHLKLDALVKTLNGVSSDLAGIEKRSDQLEKLDHEQD